MSPRKQLSLETEYDRALQSVYVIICDLFPLPVFTGLLGRGLERVRPSWGGKSQLVCYLCVLTSVIAYSPAGKASWLPRVQDPGPPRCVYTQLANLGASGLRKLDNDH